MIAELPPRAPPPHRGRPVSNVFVPGGGDRHIIAVGHYDRSLRMAWKGPVKTVPAPPMSPSLTLAFMSPHAKSPPVQESGNLRSPRRVSEARANRLHGTVDTEGPQKGR